MPLALSVLLVSAVFAIPAKPGIWQKFSIKSGGSVNVSLVGDEHYHFWIDSLGNRYSLNNDMQLVPYVSIMKVPRRLPTESIEGEEHYAGFPKNPSIFRGKKKGLIILAAFSDKDFAEADPQATFYNIANARHYSEGKFKKSVRDYFLEQSDSLFDLSFDVVGPVKLAHGFAYYGANDENGSDLRPGEMVAEACKLVDAEVDYHDYDWDDDGEVDQIFVIYPGYGESEGAPSTTIWPHEWTLSSAIGSTLTLDGMTIDTYACGNELSGISGKNLNGIGTICHEFSHCMGFPDFYDKYNFGMGAWDVMANGSRNGNGFNPAEYTAYERMICGWRQPIELKGDMDVTNLKPIDDGGETYIMYCDNPARTEYYLFENKNKSDIYPYNYSGHGLLVTHVDYSPELWYYDVPNSTATYYRDDRTMGYNTHQRMTILAADNRTTARGGYITDVFPINNNSTYEDLDSLSGYGSPCFTQYLGGDTAQILTGRKLSEITRDDAGLVSFHFSGPLTTSVKNISVANTSSTEPKEYFSLSGVCYAQPQKGLNIVKLKNGSVLKVYVKN